MESLTRAGEAGLGVSDSGYLEVEGVGESLRRGIASLFSKMTNEPCFRCVQPGPLAKPLGILGDRRRGTSPQGSAPRRAPRRLVAPECYKCYKELMDTTIRNLDPQVYRQFKARAALTGRTMGDLVNEALRGYLSRALVREKSGSLRRLVPVEFPPGTERLSEEIDAIVYGTGEP